MRAPSPRPPRILAPVPPASRCAVKTTIFVLITTHRVHIDWANILQEDYIPDWASNLFF